MRHRIGWLCSGWLLLFPSNWLGQIKPPLPPSPPLPPVHRSLPTLQTPNAKDGAEMHWITGGLFVMGDEEFKNNPRRSVTLSGYWIYKNLVTVAQFRKYCQAAHYRYDWNGRKPRWGWMDDHPMVNVTWQEAQDYCKWAGGHLPTEAQWEKAARGTDGRKYPWGDAFEGSRLWYSKEYLEQAGRTAPVGSFPSGASPYGALDMAGNVWEWCDDWYDAPLEAGGLLDNRLERVLRGGSWTDYVSVYFRTAYRYHSQPDDFQAFRGFRCVVGK